MTAMAPTINFSPNIFGKLLRKQSIEKAVVVLRVVLWAVSGLCLCLLFFDIWSSHSSLNKSQIDLTNKVDSILAGTQAAKPSPKGADLKVVSNAQIFKLTMPAAAPSPGLPLKPPSPVQLGLIGTVVTVGETPYAIIEDQKKSTQDVFMVGDDVYGAGSLKTITPDKVEIDQDGQILTLVIDETAPKGGDLKGGIASMGGDEYAVDETELNSALENLNLLLTQARAVPYFKDGKSVGLRLFAIRPGSLYEKVGLVNGDILKTINNNDLGDFTQAIKLFEKLKEERSISLTLERDGKDRTFRYSIR